MPAQGASGGPQTVCDWPKQQKRTKTEGGPSFEHGGCSFPLLTSTTHDDHRQRRQQRRRQIVAAPADNSPRRLGLSLFFSPEHRLPSFIRQTRGGERNKQRHTTTRPPRRQQKKSDDNKTTTTTTTQQPTTNDQGSNKQPERRPPVYSQQVNNSLQPLRRLLHLSHRSSGPTPLLTDVTVAQSEDLCGPASLLSEVRLHRLRDN